MLDGAIKFDWVDDPDCKNYYNCKVNGVTLGYVSRIGNPLHYYAEPYPEDVLPRTPFPTELDARIHVEEVITAWLESIYSQTEPAEIEQSEEQ